MTILFFYDELEDMFFIWIFPFGGSSITNVQEVFTDG